MNLTIRPASPADIEIIAGYNAAIASETEHIELDRERLLQGVRAVLQDESKGFYTVAELDGRVVGQIMITYEWSDWRNGVFWWIQSVYVHADFRNQGVFTRLFRHIAAKAKDAGVVCGLRLYVEKENRRAQATYQRMGMTQAPYDVLEIDFVIQRSAASGPRSDHSG